MFEILVKLALLVSFLHGDNTVKPDVGYSSKDTIEYSAKEDIGYSSKSSKDIIENIPDTLNPLDGRYYPPVIPPVIINPPYVTNVNPK
jgi:hypothetical protein